ncbi:hypothetical protein QOZ84_12045 [Romboutsia sedimentorum]|uniref:Uncharacterized protein n=1 Tax=Romboutsia sedimentorum TaxID=1368474 RepID=A0ABT7EBI2_9FIRM|nr:hypothetical protein [Romboutsia sedimentorum]MDK2564283.1 hypothetical protein [Romboutsia sedimentorum]
MQKRVKHSIKNLKEVFNSQYINEVAKNTKFVQIKSDITAQDFLAFNVFYGEDICSAPLSKLRWKTIVVNIR